MRCYETTDIYCSEASAVCHGKVLLLTVASAESAQRDDSVAFLKVAASNPRSVFTDYGDGEVE